MATLLEYEYSRLRSRGMFLIPGTIFFSFYIFLGPPLSSFLLSTLSLYFSQFLTKVLSVLITHHLSFSIHCLTLHLLSKVHHPGLEQYRLDTSWPTHLWKKARNTSLQNFFMIVPLAEIFLTELGLVTSALSEYYPPPTEVFCQLVFSMVTEDIWSYSFHRLMHEPEVYKRIHKKHHEYKASISYSAEYAHPVEFVVTNILAVGTGPMLLGKNMHFITFLVWISYRIGDTVDQHGGYDFPWSPYSIFPFASIL